jgi:hypothetical protein
VSRSRSLALRLAALAGATLVAFGIAATATPAHAAPGTGFVRLAHLSPDTPEVDVYLTSVAGAFAPKVFPAVGYGVVSDYLELPAGNYTVAMRSKDALATSEALLSKVVTVEAGKAYTVAGVGKFADKSLGIEILVDDLTRPGQGRARVRIIHASVKAPELDISLGSGAPIAEDVKFAQTTTYREVGSGRWSVRLQPVPSGQAATVDVSLGAGSVYSLIVLDGSNGLTAKLRTDAQGGSVVPAGINAGGGGQARGRTPASLLWGGAALALLLAAGLAYLLRRVGNRTS